MTKTEKILGTLFCLMMVFFIYLSNKDDSKNNEMINKNKSSTIAKVYEIKSGKNYTYARFYFIFNSEKYYSGDYVSNDLRKTINRYYRIDFSSVEPKYSRINLEQEVTDSTEIIKAGLKYERPPEE